MGNVSNIKLEPVDLEFSNPEFSKVTAIDAVVAGTYFEIKSAKDATSYYVWMDDTVAVDPAPGGTGISVVHDAVAATLAANIVTAIDAEGDFFAKIDPEDSSSVIFMTKDYGTTTASADGDSTMVVASLRTGDEFKLGFTDVLEVAVSEDLVDVIAMQKGSTILDKIRSGVNLDPIAVAMKESDAAKLKEILLGSGSAVIPGGGTEVVGMGTSKYATNISGEGRRLILHPVRNLASDITEDWCFFLSYPTLAGLNFSGDEEQMINVEFQILPDGLIQQDLEIFIKGDHKQNMLK